MNFEFDGETYAAATAPWLAKSSLSENSCGSSGDKLFSATRSAVESIAEPVLFRFSEALNLGPSVGTCQY